MHLGIGFCCFVKALGAILSIIASKFRCSKLPKRGYGMESIAKISFWWKSFLMQFGICFCCFFQKPWELVLSIADSKFRSSGLPKRGSGMESIAKIDF